MKSAPLWILTFMLFTSPMLRAGELCKPVVERYLKLIKVDLKSELVESKTISKDKFQTIHDNYRDSLKHNAKIKGLTFIKNYNEFRDGKESLTKEELDLLYVKVHNVLERDKTKKMGTALNFFEVKKLPREEVEKRIQKTIRGLSRKRVRKYPFAKSYFIPESVDAGASQVTFYNVKKSVEHSNHYIGNLIYIQKDNQNEITSISFAPYTEQKNFSEGKINTAIIDGKCHLIPEKYSFKSRLFSEIPLDLFQITKDTCGKILKAKNAMVPEDAIRDEVYAKKDFALQHVYDEYKSFKPEWTRPYIQLCEAVGEDLLTDQQMVQYDQSKNLEKANLKLAQLTQKCGELAKESDQSETNRHISSSSQEEN